MNGFNGPCKTKSTQKILFQKCTMHAIYSILAFSTEIKSNSRERARAPPIRHSIYFESVDFENNFHRISIASLNRKYKRFSGYFRIHIEFTESENCNFTGLVLLLAFFFPLPSFEMWNCVCREYLTIWPKMRIFIVKASFYTKNFIFNIIQFHVSQSKFNATKQKGKKYTQTQQNISTELITGWIA